MQECEQSSEGDRVDVAANGTTLYAEQAGEGPTLVFVHGMCGDARVWADQVRRLGDRFQCVTYDRRGHTRSPRTDTAISGRAIRGPDHARAGASVARRTSVCFIA
jgi:pimeloyl-ACP methyl ester carboxylesterase